MFPMYYTAPMSTAVADDLAGCPVVILAFLSVDSTGSLSFNGSALSPGSDPDLLAGIQQLNGGGTTVMLSVGGTDSGGVYGNISDNYDVFLANLTSTMTAYGIAGIDLDLETGDYSQYLQVCTQLVNDLSSSGWYVSAVPTAAMDFWQKLVTATQLPDGSPSILWYNLQLYGGADYAEWVTGFAKLVPNPQLFLGSGYLSGQNSPAAVGQALDELVNTYPDSTFAFLWRYPHSSDGSSAAEYIQAISTAGGATQTAAARAHIQAHRERLGRQVAVPTAGATVKTPSRTA